MTKILNARYFYTPNDDDISSDVNRIITANCFRVWARDRYGYFNKFSKINWVDKTAEIPKPDTRSLNEIMLERAKYFADRNEKINVMYSGGVDSCGALSAFMDYGKRVNVFCTKYSVEEFPEYYEKYKNHFNFIVCGNDIVQRMAEFEGYDNIISGTNGDIIMGPYSCEKHYGEACHGDFHELIRNNIKRFGIKNDIEEVNYHLDEYNKLFGGIAKSFNEMYYLLGLGFKWERGRYDRCTELRVYNPRKRVIPFYDGDSFDGWAINNIFSISKLNQSIPKLFKKPIKDFIFDSCKIDRIYDIIKVDSWVRKRYLPDIVGDVVVLDENESIQHYKFPKEVKKTYKNAVLFSDEIKKFYYK